MIVRFGLEALPAVLSEAGIARPLLVTSVRWANLELPVGARYTGVRPHAETVGVAGAIEAARAGAADGLVTLGGGSAIDTAKAVSVALALPVVSIPTTYSGAEWTSGYGSRDPATRSKVGGAGAAMVAVVYDPSLTLELPRPDTVGTALNALAHCAEALYATGRAPETDEDALTGAALIAATLPEVVEHPRELAARTRLLEGAMHAGCALRAGMGVGHAMAQALGGRFGLPHGAMNAVCLPAALRFNAEAASSAIERFGRAIGATETVTRVEELGRLGVSIQLRDYEVPREELPVVAAAAAERPAARANPRPASAEAILGLLESVW